MKSLNSDNFKDIAVGDSLMANKKAESFGLEPNMVYVVEDLWTFEYTVFLEGFGVAFPLDIFCTHYKKGSDPWDNDNIDTSNVKIGDFLIAKETPCGSYEDILIPGRSYRVRSFYESVKGKRYAEIDGIDQILFQISYHFDIIKEDNKKPEWEWVAALEEDKPEFGSQYSFKVSVNLDWGPTYTAEFEFEDGTIVELPPPGENWKAVEYEDLDKWPQTYVTYIGANTFYVERIHNKQEYFVNHESAKVILKEYAPMLVDKTIRCLWIRKWARDLVYTSNKGA